MDRRRPRIAASLPPVVRSISGAGAIAAALLVAQLAAAVAPGQLDDFEDGTTQDWRIGRGSATPTNVASGGPGGAGDAYLLLVSTGGASQASRLVVFNREQWSGDYGAAGITAIELQVANFGPTDLALRLSFEDGGTAPDANSAISTVPAHVPAQSGWMAISLPVSPGALTAVQGAPALALANTATLRVLHSPTALFPGPPIAAQLGIDDVLAVPEPRGAMAGLAAIAAIAAVQRRRIASISSARVISLRLAMPSFPASS